MTQTQSKAAFSHNEGIDKSRVRSSDLDAVPSSSRQLAPKSIRGAPSRGHPLAFLGSDVLASLLKELDAAHGTCLSVIKSMCMVSQPEVVFSTTANGYFTRSSETHEAQQQQSKGRAIDFKLLIAGFKKYTKHKTDHKSTRS